MKVSEFKTAGKLITGLGAIKALTDEMARLSIKEKLVLRRHLELLLVYMDKLSLVNLHVSVWLFNWHSVFIKTCICIF